VRKRANPTNGLKKLVFWKEKLLLQRARVCSKR
jgi:hypothetical protein